MIMNFDDLGDEIRTCQTNDDYACLFERLTSDEQVYLKLHIDTWTHQFDKLSDMFFDYFSIHGMPTVFAKQLLKDNLDLAYEVYDGCVTDTDVRDRLITALTNKLQIRSWPTYGEIREDKNCRKNFYKDLSIACAKNGFTFDNTQFED